MRTSFLSLTDRLNPVLLKELRQGLRSSLFWVMFALLLTLCLMVSLAPLSEPDNVNGDWLFWSYFMLAAVLQFFIIPYAGFRSMAREQEDETWVLLKMTGLGPRTILRGKIFSALCQGGIYLSAISPFFLFSYLLNGVSLPSIVIRVTWALVLQVFFVVVSVCLATLANSRATRSVLHFVVLAFLAAAALFGMVPMLALMRSGLMSEEKGLFVCVAFTLSALTGGWLFFEAGVSRLLLSSERYAAGPRIAYAVHLATLLALALWAVRLTSDKSDLASTVVTLLSGYAFVLSHFLMEDNDGRPSRVRVGMGQWNLLEAGAFRGFLAVTLSFVAIAAFALVLLPADDSQTQRQGWRLVAPCLGLFYVAVPTIVSRLPALAPSPRRLLFRVSSIVLQVVMWSLSLLLASGSSMQPLSEVLVSGPLAALIPMMGWGFFNLTDVALVSDDLSATVTWVAGTAAVFSALTALFILKRKDTSSTL